MTITFTDDERRLYAECFEELELTEDDTVGKIVLASWIVGPREERIAALTGVDLGDIGDPAGLLRASGVWDSDHVYVEGFDAVEHAIHVLVATGMLEVAR